MINKLKIIAALIILLTMLTQPAYADEISTYTWTAATGDIDHYLVCVTMDDGPCITIPIQPEINEVDLTFQPGIVYRVQVRAVDTEGRMSPAWSEESTPYSFTVPSMCGKPERVSK